VQASDGYKLSQKAVRHLTKSRSKCRQVFRSGGFFWLVIANPNRHREYPRWKVRWREARPTGTGGRSSITYRHCEHPRGKVRWSEAILSPSSRVPAMESAMARSDPPFEVSVSPVEIASPSAQNPSLGARNDELQKPSSRVPAMESAMARSDPPFEV
jgi:hypothetical protein